MKVFINNSIHNGITNYINYIEGKEIDKIHLFEFSVIKSLVNIYGEINIINPFKLRKEASFKTNLSIYGLKESEMEMFIKYMGDYDKWLNSANASSKTKLPIQIESIIINMVLLKSNYHQINEEEMQHYDNFFDPVDGDLTKVQNLIVEDNTIIPSLWRRKKYQLKSDIVLETIEPELLSSEEYEEYGLTLESVKQLSNLKIKEINDKIKMHEDQKGNGGKTDPKKLILTSGSGFVDTIVLLSIMVTEIMIGLLIAFSFLRR